MLSRECPTLARRGFLRGLSALPVAAAVAVPALPAGATSTPDMEALWHAYLAARGTQVVAERAWRAARDLVPWWAKPGPSFMRWDGKICGDYGEAAAKALPQAVQVANRWHLMENASAAFLDAVRKSMRPIRAAIGAMVIDPELLTAAERLQYEGYLRREETNAIILALAKSGTPIKQIVKRTGHSRKLVRQVIRGERTDVFRTRQSSLDAHLPLLDEQWASGCRNGAELWRRLKAHGFRGSLRVVGEWATRRRRAEKATNQQLQRVPSARTIARLMTTARNHLSKADTVTVAAIERGCLPSSRLVACSIGSTPWFAANAPSWTAGLETHPPASWPRSRPASARTGQRSRPPSRVRGRTAKPKGRSPSSSS